MPNHHRGETDCVVGERRLKLCLTLGALADIENGLGADGLAALGERLSNGRLATRDLVTIIAAAARGAGENLSDDELRDMPVAGALPSLVDAVAKLLRLTFESGEPQARPR